jgi:PPOX class probable F420-dependent enzyme
MFRLDPDNPDQARALERLSTDLIAWLTTVSESGRPNPSAIWFCWDGETVLMYSGDSPRMKNIVANPNISLHFNSDEHGDDITILSGLAEVDPTTPKAADVDLYRARYDAMVPAIGMDWDGFCQKYHNPIRIKLTGYRRW